MNPTFELNSDGTIVTCGKAISMLIGSRLAPTRPRKMSGVVISMIVGFVVDPRTLEGRSWRSFIMFTIVLQELDRI